MSEQIKIEYESESSSGWETARHPSLKLMAGLTQYQNWSSIVSDFTLSEVLIYNDKEYKRNLTKKEVDPYRLSEEKLDELFEYEKKVKAEKRDITLEELERLYEVFYCPNGHQTEMHVPEEGNVICMKCGFNVPKEEIRGKT